jgi:hypothetical protein
MKRARIMTENGTYVLTATTLVLEEGTMYIYNDEALVGMFRESVIIEANLSEQKGATT